MSTPALKRFDTEQELVDYADELNEAGMAPEIPLMDSSGICAFATLQAPGGDGWGFAYYTVNDPDLGAIQGEEDGWVKPARYLTGYPDDDESQPGWKPAWPVFGIVVRVGVTDLAADELVRETERLGLYPQGVTDRVSGETLPATRLPTESWDDYYRFRWDALDANINYYGGLMEDWEPDHPVSSERVYCTKCGGSFSGPHQCGRQK